MFSAAPLILGAMDEPKKPRLDQGQLADTQRLRALWAQYKAAGGLNQEEFASDFGLKSQSNLGHYLHGRQPINLRAATAFARGMKVPIAAISPTLAAEVEAAAPFLKVTPPGPKLPASLLELNGAEGQLIMFFRGLPPEEQAHVLTDLNNAFNAHAGKVPNVADPYAKIGTPAPSPVLVTGRKADREITATADSSRLDTVTDEDITILHSQLPGSKGQSSATSSNDGSVGPGKRRKRMQGDT